MRFRSPSSARRYPLVYLENGLVVTEVFERDGDLNGDGDAEDDVLVLLRPPGPHTGLAGGG